MMPRSETWNLAVDALRAHKLRSFLTVLGIIVGVGSLIAVVSVIQGLNDYFNKQVLDFGTTTFNISKFSQGFSTLDDFWRESKRKNLTLDDLQAVTDGCAHCQLTSGIFYENKTIKRKGKVIENVNVRGVTVNAPFIGSVMELSSGRHFVPADIEHSRMGIIIGADIEERLFPGEDPLEKELTLDGKTYSVVGIAKKTGAFFGQSQDTFVRIPITTFMHVYNTTTQSLNIQASATTPTDMTKAMDETRVILRNRLHRSYSQDDGFSISTADTFLDLWHNLTKAIFGVLIGLTSISLVVGGIVIMNIMLVSVTERTREIGVRKALGARQKDILGQFLAESIMLSAAGGAIGVMGGVGVAWLVSQFTPLPMAVKVWSVLLALIVSSSVGMFFGIYPARSAAKLDPVVALRQE